MQMQSEKDERRQATMETIIRRNNSISVVKKHAIPYSHLHKKTYFNALEKILISPKNLKKNANHTIPPEDPGNELEASQIMAESYMIHDSANRAFDDVFKKPPSRLGDEKPVRRNQQQKIDG